MKDERFSSKDVYPQLCFHAPKFSYYSSLLCDEIHDYFSNCLDTLVKHILQSVSANEHRRSINSDVILDRCAARILASDVIKGNPNSCAIILGMMMGLKYVLMFIHRLSQLKCLKLKEQK
jgi:hypothetical protein